MKVMIVGLGSMGCRRARILRKWGDIQCVGVDTSQERRRRAKERFHMETAASIEEAIGNSEGISAALVCTPPLSHATIIRICLERGLHVFTEINLVSDGYEENMKLAARMGRILFLSSTFLYREEINYIKKEVQKCPRADYTYHVGQYLPDWHPWENINDYFIGDKRTNGCREIMAIELPWLTLSFGAIENINVISDKISDLKISYKDNFIIQLTHKTGCKGSLVIDVVCPVAIRNFHAYTEGKYISWGGTPESIFEFDKNEKRLVQVHLDGDAEHEEGYSEFIVENAYKSEIREFFDVVKNEKKSIYGFEQDCEVLKVIDSIGA